MRFTYEVSHQGANPVTYADAIELAKAEVAEAGWQFDHIHAIESYQRSKTRYIAVTLIVAHIDAPTAAQLVEEQ